MGTTPPGVNKEVFFAAVACPSRTWFGAHKSPTPPTPGEQLRMEEGKEIGRRARALWPGGKLVNTIDVAAAAAETGWLMANTSITVIFEATLHTDGCTAKARRGGAWRILEVKSSLHNEGEVKAELIDDLAYTAMVLTQCGVKLASAELLLLNRDFDNE